jgi:hypothetical protein
VNRIPRYQKFGVGRARHAKHAIAGLEGTHVAAYGAYDTAHVLAQNGRKRQREVLLSRTGSDLPVDRVDAGGRCHETSRQRLFLVARIVLVVARVVGRIDILT